MTEKQRSAIVPTTPCGSTATMLIRSRRNGGERLAAYCSVVSCEPCRTVMICKSPELDRDTMCSDLAPDSMVDALMRNSDEGWHWEHVGTVEVPRTEIEEGLINGGGALGEQEPPRAS